MEKGTFRGSSVMTHEEKLNALCRTCGKTLVGQYVVAKQKNSRQLLAAFGTNIEEDIEGVHPPCICNSCHRKLDQWQQNKNKNNLTTLTICLPIFEAHSDECKICDSVEVGLEHGPSLQDVVEVLCLHHDLVFRVQDEVIYCMDIDYKIRNIIKSLAIKSSGEWTLHVNHYVVPVERFPNRLSILLPSNVEEFFEMLQNFFICKGNPDFLDVVRQGEPLRSSKGAILAYVEGNTVRHTQCKVLTNKERCCVCSIYRSNLNARRHYKAATSTRKDGLASSCRRNDQLSREELLAKLDFVQKERMMLKRRSDTLHRRLASELNGKNKKSLKISGTENNSNDKEGDEMASTSDIDVHCSPPKEDDEMAPSQDADLPCSPPNVSNCI